MMAPDQYERNVEIVPGSNQRVEYAIRLPGDGEVPVWLPLDAKFPMEDYDRLLDASQRGDVDAVEIAARAIEAVIRGSARAICEKHIHSPHSTDFAVLFLPTEGLFAEVVRRPGLIDALQREWHIMIAGPTTLLSLLVSLRVGFRSLAIQKHSNEVWKVLAAVKTEFWEIRRHPPQGQQKAPRDAEGHRCGGWASASGNGSQIAGRRGTAGRRGGRCARTRWA